MLCGLCEIVWGQMCELLDELVEILKAQTRLVYGSCHVSHLESSVPSFPEIAPAHITNSFLFSQMVSRISGRMYTPGFTTTSAALSLLSWLWQFCNSAGVPRRSPQIPRSLCVWCSPARFETVHQSTRRVLRQPIPSTLNRLLPPVLLHWQQTRRALCQSQCAAPTLMRLWLTRCLCSPLNIETSLRTSSCTSKAQNLAHPRICKASSTSTERKARREDRGVLHNS